MLLTKCVATSPPVSVLILSGSTSGGSAQADSTDQRKKLGESLRCFMNSRVLRGRLLRGLYQYG